MSSVALTLALAAAFLHAGWNLLLARAQDVQAATAVVLGVSLALYSPVALFTWDVDSEVWPYAAGSAAFELAYVVLLAYAYQTAELSVVYPISRGVAPVLVLVAAGSSTRTRSATCCSSWVSPRSSTWPGCCAAVGRGRSARSWGRRRSPPRSGASAPIPSSCWALQRADAAPVAAVRETSVVIAVALAAVFLHERVGPGRLAGAAVVVAGVALLSF